MSKEMAGSPYRRPYRYLIAVLFLSIQFCAMAPYISPSIFMTDIMESFGVDYSLAGLSMTIQLAATGVCFFIGSFIQDKLGMLKTIKLAVWTILVGNLIAVFSPNIYVFLFARLVSGFGQGLSVCLSAYLSTWFAGKELSYMLTFNSAASGLFIALALSIGRPIANIVGSWQGVLGVYSVIIGAIAICWTFLGKDSPEGKAQEQQRMEAAAAAGKQESSVVMAAKVPQFWKILVFCGIYMVANTAIATFLPTYLTAERGVDADVAATITSFNSICGICGSLLGGVLCAQLPKRKPIMIGALVLYIFCGFMITVANSSILLTVMCLAAGALYYLPLTAQTTLCIESASNPAMISGAMAITNGIGQLMTVIVSPLFSGITAASSMTMAYRVFFLLCFAGLAAALSLKETGKKS